MTSRERLPFGGASDTFLLLLGFGLAGRPGGRWYAGRRLTDQLAEAGQASPADDSVRRAVTPRPHEGTRYACGGQCCAHRGPRLLVGGTEAEGVALAAPGRVTAARAERPPAEPGAVEL